MATLKQMLFLSSSHCHQHDYCNSLDCSSATIWCFTDTQ